MSLHILDTNTLTLLQDGHPAVVARVAAHAPQTRGVARSPDHEHLHNADAVFQARSTGLSAQRF